MIFMGVCPNSYISQTHKFSKLQSHLRLFRPASPPPSLLFSRKLRSISGKSSIFTHSVAQNDVGTSQVQVPSAPSLTKDNDSQFSGLEDVMAGYIFGKRKSTEVAHTVWKNVVRKGDLVVDATCGNGYDTLALLRLVADDTRRGRVFAMDLQKDALESTSALLERSVSADERELVELYAMCHTKLEEVVPSGSAVRYSVFTSKINIQAPSDLSFLIYSFLSRLVAFNLGYLPGGDKKIKTESETTLLALEASTRVLARGGLVSILAYVGHAGGREEFEKVQSFAAELPVDNWTCCKLQSLNRPSAPVLVLLAKK